MSVLGTVTDLVSQTAVQSVGAERKSGSDMGKHDFLLLLSAQLRFQDPLNPQSDSDFAAGLAQFSSLEQMQNMNSTLEAMSTYQSYGLVGKFVIAETFIDGRLIEIPGVVDSIFFSNGVAMAQIGEYIVPVASIKEVFDTNNILTSEMLLTASNNLIGRMVVAEVDGEDIEGLVTRVFVDKGSLLAQIDIGEGEPIFVPVNSIVDIREQGTDKHTPKPEVPPDAVNWRDDGRGGFYETCKDGKTNLGQWTWDEAAWKWVYEDFSANKDEDKAA
ncbi:MAG: hypothetical protein FWE83_05205 [Oscillospiraceae bacterium]|nr:hypothetical protein [Oscillospiraceae bacterium]